MTMMILSPILLLQLPNRKEHIMTKKMISKPASSDLNVSNWILRRVWLAIFIVVCHVQLLPSIDSFSFHRAFGGIGKTTTTTTTTLLLKQTSIQDPQRTAVFTQSISKVKNSCDRNITNKDDNNKRTTCKHCSTVLSSRNALFRHLRTDPICSLKEGGNNLDSFQMVRESIVLLFGYEPSSNNTAESATSSDIGVLLQETIVDSLQNQTLTTATELTAAAQVVTSKYKKDNVTVPSFVSSTQATVAKMRHKALDQEPSCYAVGDVIVLNVMVPKVATIETWTNTIKDASKKLSKAYGINIIKFQILHGKKPSSQKDSVSSSKLLHAEYGCTQRIYHYLMPLSWLPNGEEIQDWWKSPEKEIDSTGSETSLPQQTHKKTAKTPASLRLFKDALRSAECIKRSPSTDSNCDDEKKIGTHEQHSSGDSMNNRVAAGRFGALGLRERRAWHNFADPTLRGDASPNNEPVWRVLDRARIVEFVEDPINGDVIAVLELRGDGFVKQQIRRIVGAAVAMTHGWLPHNYFDLATNPQTYVETPLAPSGRLYFAKARYHFEEMLSEGKPLFDNHKSRTIFELDSRERMLRRLQKLILLQKNAEYAKDEELKWLDELSTVTCKGILERLCNNSPLPADLKGGDTPGNSILSELQIPDYHLPVLNELRRILESGQWPETSVARSTVIRDDNSRKEDSECSQNKGGSFTIINPKVGKNWDALPLGNKLFKDLVNSIFEFEFNLVKDESNSVARVVLDGRHDTDAPPQAERPPSSHCAVNCNAQFTPHVDSGRGAGQSMSMIIGLGNYTGGELLVEGDAYDIRHKGLEFDGWRLRHWTNQFDGERFSLVWFTPESKNK